MRIVLISLWLVFNVADVYAAQHEQSSQEDDMWQQCIGGDEHYGCPLIMLPDGERLFVVSSDEWQEGRGEVHSILPDGTALITYRQISADRQQGVPGQQQIAPGQQHGVPSQGGIIRFLTPRGWDRGGEDYDPYTNSVEPLIPSLNR